MNMNMDMDKGGQSTFGAADDCCIFVYVVYICAIQLQLVYFEAVLVSTLDDEKIPKLISAFFIQSSIFDSILERNITTPKKIKDNTYIYISD